MTTTTRKRTGKAPWAAVLTALLAVVALVFGAMAFAGAANAKDNGNGNKPDNPGNSATAPGHQTDGTPGNSDGTPGGGNDNNGGSNGNGPDKVWVCHADANKGNGNTNLGVEGPNGMGTGGQNGTGFNILYISRNAWLNGHEGRHPADHMYETEALALAACGSVPKTPGQLCYLPTNTVKDYLDVTASDYTTALADTANYAAKCPSGGTPTPASLCDLTLVPPAMVPFADNASQLYKDAVANTAHYALTCPITDQQAAEIDAALTAVAPVQPATVAPVQPGTVAVPQPAKVTPLPATVPAGDGSSAPTVPVYALVLLALAATALAGSAVRLATRRNG